MDSPLKARLAAAAPEVVQEQPVAADADSPFDSIGLASYEPAQETEGRIVYQFERLAPLAAQLTAELHKSDPANFNNLAIQAEILMAGIEARLVAMEQHSKEQQPLIPWSLRCWAWCLGFIFSRVRQTRLAWSRQRQIRKSLLEAVEAFQNILATNRRDIQEARIAPIRHRQRLLLATSEEYQQIKGKIRDKEIERVRTDVGTYSRSQINEMLRQLRVMVEEMEQHAFEQAKEDLGRDI